MTTDRLTALRAAHALLQNAGLCAEDLLGFEYAKDFIAAVYETESSPDEVFFDTLEVYVDQAPARVDELFREHVAPLMAELGHPVELD